MTDKPVTFSKLAGPMLADLARCDAAIGTLYRVTTVFRLAPTPARYVAVQQALAAMRQLLDEKLRRTFDGAEAPEAEQLERTLDEWQRDMEEVHRQMCRRDG